MLNLTSASSSTVAHVCVCVLCRRCERCELRPLPEPGAAEGLAHGLPRELQAQLGTWGHCYRGRSYAALRSSLQILAGESPLPPTRFKICHHAVPQQFGKTLESDKSLNGYFLFLSSALRGTQISQYYEISVCVSTISICVQTSEMTGRQHLTVTF